MPTPYHSANQPVQRWTQFEVKRLAGAELWLMVRHAGRYFKLPADAACSDLLLGVQEGWSMNSPRRPGTPQMLRVELGHYLGLLEQAATGRRELGLCDELVSPPLRAD